jgi:hypothetical protein
VTLETFLMQIVGLVRSELNPFSSQPNKGIKDMNTNASLMLVEEFSEQELELISGGQQRGRQEGLVNVQNVNVEVRDINVAVAVQALTSDSFLEIEQ